MRRRLFLLELNEINFEYVAEYCERGLLPNLAVMLRDNGVSRTSSEQRYHELEPWIQWVTAHTGMSLAEHRVLRLGDIVRHDYPQIWEQLEAHGLRVGAISPMNAKNRLREAAFFVPDPWTSTPVSGPPLLQALYRALAQAVSDNAQARLTVRSVLALIGGTVRYARPRQYTRYVSLVAASGSAPWRRAMFLDRLLADIFLREIGRTQADFATLFLNAGAHIQHHYMFSAAAYRGPNRNPDWYVTRDADPVLEVYSLYDDIVGEVRRAHPYARIMIATGLHQEPHADATYYWRLRNHGDFLQKIGIRFLRVEPRMSRDFLVLCSDATEADAAAQRLRDVIAEDGTPLFEVDNRGRDLFVMLTFPRDIPAGFGFRAGRVPFSNLDRDVAFVALKNGEHDGTGYFLDSGVERGRAPKEFPLCAVPNRIMDAFGLTVAGSEVAGTAA